MTKWLTIVKWVLSLAVLLAIYWWLTQETPLKVDTVRPSVGTVEATVSNTRAGTVTACQRAKMSLPIGGQITKIAVTEGQLVQQGQLLLSLWNKDRKAKLNETQALLIASKLEKSRACIVAKNAAKETRRQGALLRDKLTSQDNFDSTQAHSDATKAVCDAAQSHIKARQAMLDGIAANIEQTYLLAPFSGIIAKITGEVGEYTTPSPPGVPIPPAIDLLTHDCHYVSAPIDEVDAARLVVGQPVRISIDAFRGSKIAGRLRRISAYVQDFEKQARTVTIEVDLVAHHDPHLLAGYSADVEVILNKKDDVLRLPSDLIINEEYVLKLNAEGVIEQAPVSIGLSNWRYTEITSGLLETDQIISSLGLTGVKAGVKATTK